MQESLTFDDVLIVPKFSNISSRKDVDVGFYSARYLSLRLPVISSNMDTITGAKMANAMLQFGGQACLHRFSSIEENVAMLKETVESGTSMVSIGLGQSELDRAYALFSAGAKHFIIDVAHGAQLSVATQAHALREIIGLNGTITVGNFATGESVDDFLYRFSKIDGVKVGIGPGSACTTRIKTGVGFPQLSAIIDVVSVLEKKGIPVIADGGLKTPGDIAKAIGAGAKLVMLGGMLAATEETPGEIIEKYDGKFKKYRGSASKESYDDQGKSASHRTAEGEAFYVPCKGPVTDVLQDIEGGLRSSFTYVGASNMQMFQKQCTFTRISSSAIAENGAHGKYNR